MEEKKLLKIFSIETKMILLIPLFLWKSDASSDTELKNKNLKREPF